MLFSLPKRFEQTSEDADGDTEEPCDDATSAVEVTRKKVMGKRLAQQVSTVEYQTSATSLLDISWLFKYPLCPHM